ncbi:MAG: zinc-dependent metalloprotease [Pirellulales bacterium]|nr:zinc-dependent metalloprotease [Pirellulales bacterium]
MRIRPHSWHALAWLVVATVLLGGPVAATRADEEAKKTEEKDKPAEEAKPAETPDKFPKWDTVTKDHKKLEGLFTLYYNADEQSLLLELRPDQLDKDILFPISVARGAGSLVLGGDTLNFGNQWVLAFRRAAERILVVRRNVQYRAAGGSPQADAVKVSYNDSVISALPIKSQRSPGGPVLIDLADLLMTDLADMGFQPDRSRSTWYNVKVFPDNVEIEVSSVFSLGFFGFFGFFFGFDDVPDARGVQVVMHYGMSMVPEDKGYQPRVADDRVGHFLSVIKDFSKDVNDTPFVRYVTRWQLEKSDPSADKSPPKTPIIFWIERTVPREYRPYVQSGILEWNKAFEKIGFVDAIQVRDQQSNDDFQPEDIRYNAFRWIATGAGFAMGPSRTNPHTGQILDADIIFDESMVRYWRSEYLTTVGLPAGLAALRGANPRAWYRQHAGDLPWVILAEPQLAKLAQDKSAMDALLARNQLGLPAPRSVAGCCSADERCRLGQGMHRQLSLLAAVLMAEGQIEPGGKVPLEYIGQAIKEVTMHEVGHTLGLRHNFKASSIVKLADAHNTELTSAKGLGGSVMDYLPANFAVGGQKQGHYFSPTIGPYDYWAIEYAYKPISGDEAAELKKIASRVAEEDLTFATDDDFASPDPRINLFDLGDPLDYAQQRVQLVEERLKGLAERVVAEGEGWQRARQAVYMLLSELSSAGYLASSYIGGEYTNRDHRGDPNGRTPFEPIPVAKQREAIKFLQEHVLNVDAKAFSPDLLRRLAPEFWSHWGEYGGAEPSVELRYVLSRIQSRIVTRMLDGYVLTTVQEVENHAAPDQEILRLPEVFDAIDQAVWSDLPAEAPAAEQAVNIAALRRDLQRAHIRKLGTMVLGPKSSFGDFYGGMLYYFESPAPPDARSLARLHLKRLGERIKNTVGSPAKLDDLTRAHLEEIDEQITQVLAASLEVNEL